MSWHTGSSNPHTIPPHFPPEWLEAGQGATGTNLVQLSPEWPLLIPPSFYPTGAPETMTTGNQGKEWLRAESRTKGVKGAMCEKFVHMRSWVTRDVSLSKNKSRSKVILIASEESREMIHTDASRCVMVAWLNDHMNPFYGSSMNINHHSLNINQLSKTFKKC